jgi:hypothetical protein
MSATPAIKGNAMNHTQKAKAMIDNDASAILPCKIKQAVNVIGKFNELQARQVKTDGRNNSIAKPVIPETLGEIFSRAS